MKLAKVVGNVVSTIKTPTHQNKKLMVVVPVDEKGEKCGDAMIALDRFHAGVDDYVLILEEGGSAREILGDANGAFDAVIAGIVDRLQ
ncbi:Carbon dioxide concentrating mechanism protein CcmL [Bacillus sp. THAF10]|uniref:EutN/CcmL family microcompartment protein n=1 Tax=Bacillus sp. THAF10 TaxID=2587848 RepID=UPI0012683C79|nr:EutN/CcmL family microcompartment protein [Bacillus sp. THAF10]QFT91063.1 Carbon dioxide concentrating mechanism protein CcmL [Bacillus sp. THAF10]